MAQTNLQGSLEQTPLTPHMEDERRLHPPIDSPSSVLAHTNTGTRPLTVDDIKASPYYCLISARCKICEFEIAEGDGVVASKHIKTHMKRLHANVCSISPRQAGDHLAAFSLLPRCSLPRHQGFHHVSHVHEVQMQPQVQVHHSLSHPLL